MTDIKSKTSKKGSALLVVLFIIMLIMICSLGFLSRSDVELATGQNMALRIQMDYLAESGLEHAKGLILNPQDISSEYWTGATGQQLVAGNDYYDIAVARDDSDPTNRCNYIIDCNSYRLRNGEKIGRCNIRAELRLDPCISLWTGNDTGIWSGVTINGDVYCDGTLINDGLIDGDVFANILSGIITGRNKPTANLSLAWPRVTVADFTSNYSIQTISSSSLSNQTFGPYNPIRVCYYSGNLTLAGNVQIDGMLVVEGNLIVQGSANIITSAKNLPALLVTGDLIIESGGNLEVNGLAVIDAQMQVSADAGNINILGGLFIQGALAEITEETSSSSNNGTVIGASWTPGKTGNALDFDGVDDHVKISIDPSLDNLTDITMSAWIYPRVDSHWHVLDKGDGCKRLFADGANRKLSGIVRYTGSIAISSSVSNTIILNSWQHVALTWSQTTNTIQLFHNGTEVQYSTQTAGTGSLADDTTYPFIIGARGALDSITFFNGIIDEVHLYNRVLDPNDIYPPKGGLAGLVGHWKLDESGSNVTITAAPSKTAIFVWSAMGMKEKWGQSAGAFFKSIQRQ